MEADVDLKQLRTFLAVTQHGSFARAAEELDYAQSTVTLHIQSLETRYGIALFTRQGRRAELTEAGRTLRDRAHQLLADAATLQGTMGEFGLGVAGHVRIGALESAASILLLPILVRFMDERPNVQLRLDAGSTTGICDRIVGGDLDIGLCSPPAPELGLVWEPLFEERFVLLLPEGHSLAVRPVICLDDLGCERLLVSEQGCQYREPVDAALRTLGSQPRTTIQIGTVVGLKRAVQAGLGIAILPIAPVVPTPAGTVVRELDGVDIRLPVGLVRRPSDAFGSRALTILTERIRAELRGVSPENAIAGVSVSQLAR